jgi:hypothetical protein
MNTFTNIYHDEIEQYLMFYELDKKLLHNNTIMYKLELEFNEERSIEIELHLKANDIISELYIFYLLVQDARTSCCITEFSDCQEFSECKLVATKLHHLLGKDLYDKFLNCDMNYVI